MHLYLVTPPESEGGRDDEMLVSAESAGAAVRLFQSVLDGRKGEHVQLNDVDPEPDEVWIARELPAPYGRPEVHDWSHCAFTFWEPLP